MGLFDMGTFCGAVLMAAPDSSTNRIISIISAGFNHYGFHTSLNVKVGYLDTRALKRKALMYVSDYPVAVETLQWFAIFFFCYRKLCAFCFHE